MSLRVVRLCGNRKSVNSNRCLSTSHELEICHHQEKASACLQRTFSEHSCQQFFQFVSSMRLLMFGSLEPGNTSSSVLTSLVLSERSFTSALCAVTRLLKDTDCANKRLGVSHQSRGLNESNVTRRPVGAQINHF